jgi:hypothetical protein
MAPLHLKESAVSCNISLATLRAPSRQSPAKKEDECAPCRPNCSGLRVARRSAAQQEHPAATLQHAIGNQNVLLFRLQQPRSVHHRESYLPVQLDWRSADFAMERAWPSSRCRLMTRTTDTTPRSWSVATSGDKPPRPTANTIARQKISGRSPLSLSLQTP